MNLRTVQRWLMDLADVLGVQRSYFVEGEEGEGAEPWRPVLDRLDRIERAQGEQRRATRLSQQLLQELVARLDPDEREGRDSASS